jgi:hypothetical protein
LLLCQAFGFLLRMNKSSSAANYIFQPADLSFIFTSRAFLYEEIFWVNLNRQPRNLNNLSAF